MATESSRKMGGENPSLSANDLKLTAFQESLSLRDFVAPKGLATLRVPFPSPLAAGPLHGEMCLENGDSMSTI